MASAAIAVGLAISPASQAASTIDLPQPGENTIQASIGQGIFDPQFALWPIPNFSDNRTDANEAAGRGNDISGQWWLLGLGAGNVVQFATGGNIVAPQFALGTDNISHQTAYGNWAEYNGNLSDTDSTGEIGHGLLMDGNGNVLQVAFLQGNIIAPQVSVFGDNDADLWSQGNVAKVNGNGSSTFGENGFAFVTGNGNIIQIQILSNNIIAPQFALVGDNTIVAYTDGNDAYTNGNGNVPLLDDEGKPVLSPRAVTNVNGSNPLAGIFAVTGNGNVTQISILSNNIWAPQFALFGTNRSELTAISNDSEENGNDADTTGETTPQVTHPVLDSVRSALNEITGNTNRPVLDAIEKALPKNQFGNGNTQQTANGSGAIYNDQIAGPTVKVKVEAPVSVPEPAPAPTVAESLGDRAGGPSGGNDNIGKDKIGDDIKELVKVESTAQTGGNNKATTPKKKAGGWKPGDGLKKLKAKLAPKKKAADSGAS